MTQNPGVFHKTVFAKGSYSSVEADTDTLAITAVLMAMDTFPEDKMYQVVKAIFSNQKDLASVAKEVAKLTPEMAVKQANADAQKFIHAGAAKYYAEKGAL